MITTQTFKTTEQPIDSLSEVSYSNLKRGDRIGYVFTGAEFVQSWRAGVVLAIDHSESPSIATVETYSTGISTFHSDCDSLAMWKD